MSEWINVKDRLPETNREVLVCFNLYEPIFRQNRKIARYGLIGIKSLREYPVGNLIWEDEDYHQVTHWMYLPEVPKN